MLPKQGGG